MKTQRQCSICTPYLRRNSQALLWWLHREESPEDKDANAVCAQLSRGRTSKPRKRKFQTENQFAEADYHRNINKFK